MNKYLNKFTGKVVKAYNVQQESEIDIMLYGKVVQVKVYPNQWVVYVDENTTDILNDNIFQRVYSPVTELLFD